MMIRLLSLATCFSLPLLTACSALEKKHEKPEPMGPGIKPTTPEIPGTPWRVHDGTRPQPVAVNAAGALTTPAPGDAIVLFDGTSTDAWLDAKNGGPCPWVIKDGVLVDPAAALGVAHDDELSSSWSYRRRLHVR